MIDEKPPEGDGDEPQAPKFTEGIDNKPVTPDEAHAADESFQKEMEDVTVPLGEKPGFMTRMTEGYKRRSTIAKVGLAIALGTGAYAAGESGLVGKAAGGVAEAVKDPFTTTPEEIKEHNEELYRESIQKVHDKYESRYQEIKKPEYTDEVLEIYKDIYESDYQGDKNDLYIMTRMFPLDEKARVGYQEKVVKVAEDIESLKIFSDKGYNEFIEPIVENDKLILEEEEDFRVKAVGFVLRSDLSIERKAELLVKIRDSISFSFARVRYTSDAQHSLANA